MRRAGINARISRDSEGDGLGIARQEAACRQLAATLGWEIIDVYADNSISAYDRRKKRPQYERMLADIETGKIDAVLAWSIDRLTRHPMELERLVDVFQRHDTAVQTVVGGDLNLNTEEGKLRARIMGNVATFESGRKSERIKEKVQEIVKSGRRPCGGPRPFGITRIYDDPDRKDRRILQEVLNEEEAALIRDAVDRVLGGESRWSVLTGWHEAGIVSTLGNPWSLTSFTQMLIAPRLAGIVTHHGKEVEGTEAAWPAIISREQHEALVAKIAYRSTKRESNALKFWLTGYVYCTCESPMRTSKGTNLARKYDCLPKIQGGCGGRSINYDGLDDFMTRLVVARLSDPKILREIAARQTTSKRQARELVDAIETDERRLATLRAQLPDCQPEEIFDVRSSMRTVRARIDTTRTKLAQMTGETELAGVDADDLRARMAVMDPIPKAALLRVAGIEKVVIHPARARGRFDPDRVEIVPIRKR